MQCGELVYRKVPIITQNRNEMKHEKETIHSGHFMVSHFEAEAQDDEDELTGAVPVPDAEDTEKLTVVGVAPAGTNPQIFITANKNDYQCSQQLSIETSLTKLFQCMSLAYRQKLTSPKWNRFKGIRLRWKDKIRLNNVIWRCWHMQFIMKQNTLVCQFASPLDVDTHNKPEAVVLEGKYWKRRLAAVTAEYKKWRLFHRNRILGWSYRDGCDSLLHMDVPDWQPNSVEDHSMLVDQDYMEFMMPDTLFSTISANQPFAFPDSREIARAGLADFIQPSLGPLQPNLDDFMDTFEPLQDLISYSKLPSVPEEPSNEDIYRTNFTELDLISTDATSNMQQQQQTSPLSAAITMLPTQQTEYITPHKPELTEDEFNAANTVTAESQTTAVDNFGNVDLYQSTEQPQQQIEALANVLEKQQRISHEQNMSRSSKIRQQFEQLQALATQQQAAIQRQAVAVQNFQTMQQQSATPSVLQSQQNTQPSTAQQQIYNANLNSLNTQFQNYQTITITSSNERPITAAFKIPSPPPLINTQQNIHKTQAQTQTIKFQNSAQQQQVAADNFKIPSLPLNQNWSPPPSSSTLQTYQAQPVQLIQVADLNNIVQQTPQTGQINDVRTNNSQQQYMTTASNNTTNKYPTSINQKQQRGRVRSLSLGPRQAPPQLRSSASDPALLSNTNSVLLAQLLTNNTQTVYNFNTSAGANATSDNKTTLLQTAGGIVSNISNKTSTSNLTPLLTIPSQQSPTTTTLLIRTPVSAIPCVEVQTATANLQTQQNQMILNQLGGSSSNISTQQVGSSPKSSITNESPLSPLSPAESLGSPSMRSSDRSPGAPRENNRRVGHIHAEQKRRYNIKNGFDTLHSLIPQLNQNPNAKLSKAAMLQKGAEYIRQLKAERSQLKDEMDNLKQQIECLNTSISNCQSMLPATGAPVSRQRTNKMREMFDEYVRIRTQENWKFWIFSLLFEPLLTSYNNSVSTSSLEDLYRSTLLWIEQHCSLVDLRPAVLNNLRSLSTKTEILTEPSKLPDEARKAVSTKTHKFNSDHH